MGPINEGHRTHAADRATVPMEEGLAFASMCVANDKGVSYDLVSRCLLSACCLRSWASVSQVPFVFIVDVDLPAAAKTFLRQQTNATLVEVTGAPRWPSSVRWPTPPPRAYSFRKLQIWSLNFTRVLFFDADAFFMRDPLELVSSFRGAASLVAASYPNDPAGTWHLNSGLMLLRPSKQVHESLMHRWATGDFVALRSFQDSTEQDLLIAAYQGRFAHLGRCDNYRGRHRPYQQDCERTAVVVHSSHPFYMEMARKRLAQAPAASRCLGSLGTSLQLTSLQLRRRREGGQRDSLRHI